MQFLMAGHQGNVVAVQQPIDLLAGEGNHFVVRVRPPELLFRQRFVIQYKPIVLPEQTLDFVVAAIDKSIQCAIKGVMAKLSFHNSAKAIDRFSKIYRVPVQINLWHVIGGAKVARCHN